MEAVALGIYVQKHTGQAAWTGTVAAAAFVPIAIIGPLGGALADRFARKWLLITTSLVQTGLAALLAYLLFTGSPSAPTVTLIAFGNGICAALGFPAFQAILPDLVPVEVLPGAIALSSAQYNLGRVVGPVLAGVVIGTDRFAAAEAVNAISFLAVVVVLLTLTLPAPAPHARDEGLWRSIARGFRFVRREPGLRVNILAMCLNTFLAAPFIALVPTMALEVLNAPHGTAVLITAQGIGAVAMALMLGGLVERNGPRRVLLMMMGSLPFALAGVRTRTDARGLGAHALLRRRPLPRRAVVVHDDRPAPIARRDPGSCALGAHDDPRLAVPARRGAPGQDRRQRRPPRDDARRGRAAPGASSCSRASCGRASPRRSTSRSR